ncbi:MAG: ArsA family ATPase, partial [Burkholderiaceae bacterium]
MPQKAAKPRLHVFLGAGGVGKTTLSAGFALALARKGFRVGLISVDPARRLKDALGVSELSEEGTVIAVGGAASDHGAQGSLKAAFLNVSACFTRWVEQEGMQPQARERLFENRLFRALVEKFATATDTFAAVRVAEWSERESFDHVVVDTAPGLHALDFLSKPDKLMAFLDSKLVDWLKWFVGADPSKRSLMHRVFKAGARRIIDGLAQIGGQNFLVNFGEFLVLLDDVFATMLRRLGDVVNWMRSDKAHFYLVTAVREDAVFVARRLMSELQRLETRKRTSIVNKAFPDVLASDPG